MKKKIVFAVCAVAVSLAALISYPFFAFHSCSDKKTVMDLPENLKYDFSDFDMNKFQKYDEIKTEHTTPSGESFMSVRKYYSNEKTDEHLTMITKESDGSFVKGYYVSSYCSCVYYPDSTMKLFGGKTGKVYCFKKGKLKYISEMKTCKRIFSSVYVITYFDCDAQRIAIETQTAYYNGNVKAVRFLYNRRYNRFFLPVCEKSFYEKVYE